MRKAIQTLKFAMLTALVALVPVAVPAAFTGVAFAAGNPTASTAASDPATKGNCSDVSKCDLIQKFVNPLIKVLTALVGLAVVISIIVGGIEYSSSAGDPSKASAAKNRIRNAIVALITFIALLSILNFLIPGGLT